MPYPAVPSLIPNNFSFLKVSAICCLLPNSIGPCFQSILHNIPSGSPPYIVPHYIVWSLKSITFVIAITLSSLSDVGSISIILLPLNAVKNCDKSRKRSAFSPEICCRTLCSIRVFLNSTKRVHHRQKQTVQNTKPAGLRLPLATHPSASDSATGWHRAL